MNLFNKIKKLNWQVIYIMGLDLFFWFGLIYIIIHINKGE